jgi:succinate-semialdehyde dehydrogenase
VSTDILEIIKKSKTALENLRNSSQEQVDEMCKCIAQAVATHAKELAEQAVLETELGNVPDKIAKNIGIGLGVWSTMKNKKSVGIIREDAERGITYVAQPKGVIGCVTPCTNPSLTALGNAMLAIKGRNTVIISPHPRAKNVTYNTVKIMNDALKVIGAPENIIQTITEPSTEITKELMSLVDVVLATGGMGMIHSAYSSGKPAFGVGQGNVQTILGDDCDDFTKIAKEIVDSRSFDNGIICAGDQCVIVPAKHEKLVIDAFVANNAFYCSESHVIDKVKRVVFENNQISRHVIGKTALQIAELAGISVPKNTKALLLKVDKYGEDEILCSEKMCPIMAFATYETFEDAINIARTNLLYQGAGHTASLYTNDRQRVEYAGINLPVCRVMVNLPGLSATGVGKMSNLNPTPSIGCGSFGNNSISENLTYEHLIDVTQIAMPRSGTMPTDAEIWDE